MGWKWKWTDVGSWVYWLSLMLVQINAAASDGWMLGDCEAIFCLLLISLARSAASSLPHGCASMHGQCKPWKKTQSQVLTLAMEVEFPKGQS